MDRDDVVIARSEPDGWGDQVAAAQANQRRLMALGDRFDPCPECGAIDAFYRLDCVHRDDYCPERRG